MDLVVKAVQQLLLIYIASDSFTALTRQVLDSMLAHLN